MWAVLVLVCVMLVSSSEAKPSTESTHDMLHRLGFESVGVNHHRKRVALDGSKARYSSDSDSHMYVVKLPPHPPYYAHNKPEKFTNEVNAPSAVSFRTNGQPARVYHWNIPVLNKTPYKNQSKKNYGDSKIYHVKIRNDKEVYSKKHKHEKVAETPLKYHKNNVKFYKAHNSTKPHVLSIKELAENGLEALKYQQEEHQNDRPIVEHKTKHLGRKHVNKNHDNEVFHIKKDEIKGKNDSPIFYSPAIPKQNSFYKYFSGNGKPKSFYVIEKSEKPSRFHRLL